MSFNDDSDIRGGRVSKRGRNTAIGVGGGGIGVAIVVFLIAQFTGVDLSGVVGGGGSGGGQAGPDTSLEAECQTGADADANVDCRVQAAATLLDDYWVTQFDSGYVQPEVIIFDQATTTGCGDATAAVGPFYCPPDQKIYLDVTFFDELQSRFGAEGGPLGQLYVIAHEWGHHIQNLTGVMQNLDRQTTGPTSDGVRLELQADCYAGSWIKDVDGQTDDQGRRIIEPITDAQIADALSAAAAVGDDHIQEELGGGQVNPETWTHGSSEQRQAWFNRGLAGGPAQCDTFAASDDEVLNG